MRRFNTYKPKNTTNTATVSNFPSGCTLVCDKCNIRNENMLKNNDQFILNLNNMHKSNYFHGLTSWMRLPREKRSSMQTSPRLERQLARTSGSVSCTTHSSTPTRDSLYAGIMSPEKCFLHAANFLSGCL